MEPRSKRQRSENWLQEDKIILKQLVRERVSVLENKNTDANTNAKKVAAWNDLRLSFNRMAYSPRTLQQLKAQWGIIKMTEKKKVLERKERFKTGGGPPAVTEPPSGEDFAVWLPNECTVDSNQSDSDNQNFPIIEIDEKPLDVQYDSGLSTHNDITEMITNAKNDAVLLIAEKETARRKELHEAQMANEKQKLKNLMLKEEVLKYKLEYYKNKLNC